MTVTVALAIDHHMDRHRASAQRSQVHHRRYFAACLLRGRRSRRARLAEFLHFLRFLRCLGFLLDQGALARLFRFTNPFRSVHGDRRRTRGTSRHRPTSADLMAQEYGRYFGMKVGIFRGVCLTGPSHSGVELHGFLSYLVKVAIYGRIYSVFGYKAKQVRDNIHSHDVVHAIEEFAANPRPGEVYNLGGGRENSISMLEAIAKVEQMTEKN